MEFDFQTIAFAFSLTLLAGLATGIGSCIAFLAKRTNTRFLCLSLGFSAGVMLYVSFVEILVEARHTLSGAYGDVAGSWMTVLAFFGGIAFIAAIDKLVPGNDNPHEMRLVEEMQECVNRPTHMERQECMGEDGLSRLRRTGVFTALAIGIHNFPEGLATFTMALNEPATGIAIAVAIAIHNIPEGIAVSVPMYYATGSRTKAFTWSFLSGLAEPLGALVGFLLLMPFFTPALFGMLFAGVAGIMVFISLDELLPAAEQYGEHHLCIYGLIAGMGVMALSLLLLM
ncbi:zinc transporter ZupT [Desulfovibrio sp. OttesenSCG-928-F20]|nr:zinc transporter ZupT [Desulfovibrio sp. OttesenSCG-928-M16]MDL2291318.1 zinc transporter ZupT [Desulfovibrio sp. OttesenSCG-928-F20]